MSEPVSLRRRASIDLGTNTCLLLIADVDALGSVTTILEDHAQVVRLGQGVDQARRLHVEAKERTLKCLRHYAARLRHYAIEPGSVIAVATSQARDAADAESFFSDIEQEFGLKFRTLSGEQEARASFYGALVPGRDIVDQSFVVDIGGGSTEFRNQDQGVSLDLGSVRFTERYLATDATHAVTDQAFWAAEDAIDRSLAGAKAVLHPILEGRVGVGVAGTVTALASLQLGLRVFDAQRLEQVILSRGDLHRWVEELKWRSPQERTRDLGIDPGRADVLLAGAMILWRAAELFDLPPLRVSTRGLRFGVFRLS